MSHNTDDIRIREIKELNPPATVMRELECTKEASAVVHSARESIHKILHGMDDRLIVVVGPCSIHDEISALDYAKRLNEVRRELKKELEIVMRVYFEKPRTTVGWKGLINDPDLDDSFNINKGIRIARRLLLSINGFGLPAGSEYLDMITPQYIADLVSWGAIGARTTESQSHRELASGLSCPVGFKNGTDGNIKIAIDAIKTASQPHHFLSVTKGGHSAIISTEGNENCHIILRGGKKPNYDAESIQISCEELGRAGIAPRIMVDASHSNSNKNHNNQPIVIENISEQLETGDSRIIGVMIESFIESGRQDLNNSQDLIYGKSVTDACIDWETTIKILERLSKAVKNRRQVLSHEQD
ncbi:3-deoxy-7-phosphoheptulonate synthase [Candidatus Kinetoplastibacterium blastocrithidii TCC012E]|uniref:Phospho-2-dehydro-3-deoxyheptonate aldolase n=1 Tax=Candidatus Kinetoplastidibacterium blastocrithidiae TCC012E TaxID=1208922 RepID=M1M0J4_9PROT|nr:3-deoxy-7-phosphoheptulonate synthase [Candidatus Kinetoplastibacterium blastocrithidii]AFZ83669.1 3-deoxy-7-phosphoheptulonate synthase [Candidatus Kinetoplastibacterium blastocrithidii (ex Strigomonas culicis)]AGF49791.1 3-deoxy-7-phosphoheptulonate synthase [Candidatus Kinetoplastibacterium blastocrithidii TCC012E]